jgi:hypothetical protein
MIERLGDLVEHGRGLLSAGGAPAGQQVGQLFFERGDEPTRHLLARRREDYERAASVIGRRLALDPAALGHTGDEMWNVRAVAAECLREPADRGRSHGGAQELGLGWGQTVLAARALEGVDKGDAEATERLGHAR